MGSMMGWMMGFGRLAAVLVVILLIADIRHHPMRPKIGKVLSIQ